MEGRILRTRATVNDAFKEMYRRFLRLKISEDLETEEDESLTDESKVDDAFKRLRDWEGLETEE